VGGHVDEAFVEVHAYIAIRCRASLSCGAGPVLTGKSPTSGRGRASIGYGVRKFVSSEHIGVARTAAEVFLVSSSRSRPMARRVSAGLLSGLYAKAALLRPLVSDEFRDFGTRVDPLGTSGGFPMTTCSQQLQAG